MTETAEQTQPAVAVRRERDPFFDNAKLLAIVLVVIGHAWEPLRDSRAVWAAYLLVFMFHMPVFIVVSGYFSRGFEARPRQAQRLITGLAVPYVIFEVAYNLFARCVGGRHNTISLTTPWYLTWFLVALFIWRLTAPVWKHVRWPFAIAVVISLLACATRLDADLSLDRVLQLLPFFVLGLVLTPEHWEKLRAPWVRPTAAVIFGCAAIIAYWAKPHMTAEWTYHRRDWSEMHVSQPVGLVMSTALIAASVVLTAAFLAWVPRHRTWYTPLGEGTLYAYLLHGFCIRTATFLGWYDHAFWHTPQGEVAVTVLAAAVALVLTTQPVRQSFRCVVEPTLNWAFRADAAQDRVVRTKIPVRSGPKHKAR